MVTYQHALSSIISGHMCSPHACIYIYLNRFHWFSGGSGMTNQGLWFLIKHPNYSWMVEHTVINKTIQRFALLYLSNVLKYTCTETQPTCTIISGHKCEHHMHAIRYTWLDSMGVTAAVVGSVKGCESYTQQMQHSNQKDYASHISQNV